MYLGIDTHTRYAQVAVVDDDGNLHDELRIPNDKLEQLAEQYAGSEAAIEATENYRPIYEVLDEHLNVTIANPSKDRLIADTTVKTDRLDAKRLALMLRSGMLEKATSRRTRSANCGISSLIVKASSMNEQPRKIASDRFSNERIMPTRVNCSVRMGESSLQNSRSALPTEQSLRLISP